MNELQMHHVNIIENIAYQIPLEEFDNKEYIVGTEHYDWYTSKNDIKKYSSRKDQRYEEQIYDFLHTQNNQFPILILRGGIGSGKTTTIRYCISKNNMEYCKQCRESCDSEPYIIYIDFTTIPDNVFVESRSRSPLNSNEVWNRIEAVLGSIIYEMSKKDEVTAFWRWLCQRRKRIDTGDLRGVLDAYKDEIELQKKTDDLISECRKLHMGLSLEEKCLYWVYMMAYFCRSKPYSWCNIIVFDNFDQLYCDEQQLVFRFAQKICSFVNCKIIIPMRPLTMAQNTSGAKLSMFLDHCSPRLMKLLEKRLKEYRKKEHSIKEVSIILDSLIKRINKQKVIQDAIMSTCGNYCRYAIRNIVNMLLNPNLPVDFKKNLNIFNKPELTTDIFFEAYYCSNNNFLNIKQYPNLFDLVGTTEPGKRLIQIRILHYLYCAVQYKSNIQAIINTMNLFDYSIDLILLAINNLLTRRRELIWSNGTYSYKQDSFESSTDIIQLSPIGVGFYTNMINDPHYIRECVFSTTGRREKGLDAWVPTVREFMSELVENDKKEIENVVRLSGQRVYRQIYGARLCISKIIWDSFSKRLTSIIRKAPIFYDPKYYNAIWMNISDSISNFSSDIQKEKYMEKTINGNREINNDSENYTNFDLHIAPNGHVVANSIEGEATEDISIEVPNNIKLAEEIIEKNNANSILLKTIGQELYGWLFPPNIHTHFQQTEAVSRRDNTKIRLRLRIENDNIARLPLEFIYRKNGEYFMAINPSTVLSRYLNLPLPPEKVRRREGPLHMLTIISDPTDQARLDPDVWESLIQDALNKLLSDRKMTLQTVKKATRKEIRDALLKQKPDIIQFVGHGIYKDGKGHLALVNEPTGKTWLVDDNLFANIYMGYDDNLGLISLATCESAKSDDPQGFIGIAPQLVQLGVPAVLSMQYKVTINTAKIFLEAFYASVAARKPIDWATQTARNAVSQELGQDNREFATPVLYMRARDGNLF
jgi:CHAT domain-containing protein